MHIHVGAYIVKRSRRGEAGALRPLARAAAYDLSSPETDIAASAPAVSARGGRTAHSSREVTPPPPWRNVRS
jgi:hypothetical protein